jgi:AraC-like DNA-binding protein
MKNEFETVNHTLMTNLKFLLVDITYRAPHLHFDIEVVYVLEGQGDVRTQERTFRIEKGQIIIFNSCQVHEFHSESSMSLLILQFDPALFEMIAPHFGRLQFQSIPFSLSEKSETIGYYFKAGLSYFKEKEQLLFKIFGYVSLFLSDILDENLYIVLNGAEINKQADREERIQRISAYIHENFTRRIILDDLAALENFSRTYFSHFFKKNFGITFKEYLENLRCEKAKILLQTTHDNLLSITYECGFSDIRTLNHAFKRFYGILPKEARRGEPFILRASPEILNGADNQLLFDSKISFELIHTYMEKVFITKNE